MRNLIKFAIIFSVSLAEDDIQELGYDCTEAEFRTYFEIPADATIDEKKMTSSFKMNKTINEEELGYFCNAAEKKTLSKFLESNPKAAKKPATSKTDAAAKAKAKEEAAAKKAAEKEAKAKAKEEAAAKKKAEKEAKAKERAEAKKKKDAERAAAKKEKEEERAKKKAEREAAAKEKARLAAIPKELSRSKQIFILQGKGKTVKEILEANPTWSATHVRNAWFSAKKSLENDPADNNLVFNAQEQLKARTKWEKSAAGKRHLAEQS